MYEKIEKAIIDMDAIMGTKNAKVKKPKKRNQDAVKKKTMKHLRLENFKAI